ncbi:MAG: acyltransferase domain-containing protein, partial [Actinomycetota bacterium]
CLHFPEVRRTFDAIDKVYREGGRSYVPSDFIFPRPTFFPDEKQWADRQLWDMDFAPAAVLTANEALLKLVEGLGIRPDVVLGHSSGEWSALRAAGVFGTTADDRDRWIAAELLDVYRDTMNNDFIPAAVLLAIGADGAQVAEILADIGGNAAIAMDNCPHQVVVAADPGSAGAVADAARARSLVVEVLEFDRPYHTPDFAPYSHRLHSALEPLNLKSPHTPVISCVNGDRFKPDPASIKRLASDQWVMPVRFRQTVEDLYDEENVRFFIEVGPRGNLSAFVEDTLRGKKPCIVSANQQRRSGITQLNHLAGMLSAQGLDLNLGFLFRWRNPQLVDLTAVPATRGPVGTLLSTQFPEMQIPEELAQKLRSHHPRAAVGSVGSTPMAPVETPPAGSPSQPATGPSAPIPVSGEASATHSFLSTMEEFLGVQERVMRAYLSGMPAGVGDTAPQRPVGTALTSSNGHSWGDGYPAKPHAVFPADSPMADPAVPEAHSVFEEPESLAAPKPSAPVEADLETVLREIVSERTGYPIETVALTADLEADLGIDSIKRVEIMGTFRRKLTGYLGIEIEHLTGQRTLQGVIDIVASAR